jgi:phosphatidate cytidylyltransferase
MAPLMDSVDPNAATSPSSPSEPSRFANLGVRVASAIAMAAVALGALSAGFPFWPLLVLLIALGTGWEWNRMLARSGSAAALGLLAGLGVVTGLAAFGQAAFALIAAIVGTIALMAIGTGKGRKTHAAGLLYFGLPAIALVWLGSDASHGALALLYVMVVVWVTDTAAFFTGRMLGGAKLWPSVSPNKTWSGSVGGLAGGSAAGILFAALAGAGPLGWIAVLSLGLSVACQAGDLFESALKRRYDRKDTSSLVPGHGGLMDRLDGLIAAVLVAAIVSLAVSPSRPGEALLPGLLR